MTTENKQRKKVHYQITMNNEDSKKLEALSEYYAIPKASVVKFLISKNYRELQYEIND